MLGSDHAGVKVLADAGQADLDGFDKGPGQEGGRVEVAVGLDVCEDNYCELGVQHPLFLLELCQVFLSVLLGPSLERFQEISLFFVFLENVILFDFEEQVCELFDPAVQPDLIYLVVCRESDI